MISGAYALDSQSKPAIGSNSSGSNVSSGTAEEHGASDVGEEAPIFILSPEKGTNRDVYNYVILPPLSFEPPQRIILTWLTPERPSVNSSNYSNLSVITRNMTYWTGYYPIVLSMRIPDDYEERFAGRIESTLKIGTKLYSIRGPDISSYETESIMQMENGSWSYNFNILSDGKYQICPSCDYYTGQKNRLAPCRNNTPGKEDSLIWLIPRDNGAPNKCRSSLIRWP